MPGQVEIDAGVAPFPHLGEVTHAAQQAVGDSRRAPGATGHLVEGIRRGPHPEHPARAHQDARQIGRRVVLETRGPAKAIAQWRGEEPGSGRRPNQREVREVQSDRTGAGPLADQEVELKILHGGVEDLLHARGQAMDLIDEEHITGLEIREQGCQVAGALDGGTTGGPQGCAHLVGDHAGERRLSQPRRAVKEHVVETFSTLPGSLDEHPEVLPQALLADHLIEAGGSKALLELPLVFEHAGADLAPGGLGHRASRFKAARTMDSTDSSSTSSSRSTSPSTRSAWAFA
jgi:hypothetical protein